MTTIYCTRADVASISGEAALIANTDDDQTGVENSDYITDAINRAAVEMNHALDNQYILSQLSGNDWCRWVNAYLAAYFLFSRTANPVPPSIEIACERYRDDLEKIRWGRDSIPEQAPSFEHIPTVSNMVPELRKSPPIRVERESSTGSDPVGNRKRNPAYLPESL